MAKRPHRLQENWLYASVCLVYPSLCLLSQLIEPPLALKHVLVWPITVIITLVMTVMMPHAFHQVFISELKDLPYHYQQQNQTYSL